MRIWRAAIPQLAWGPLFLPLKQLLESAPTLSSSGRFSPGPAVRGTDGRETSGLAEPLTPLEFCSSGRPEGRRCWGAWLELGVQSCGPAEGGSGLRGPPRQESTMSGCLSVGHLGLALAQPFRASSPQSPHRVYTSFLLLRPFQVHRGRQPAGRVVFHLVKQPVGLCFRL